MDDPTLQWGYMLAPTDNLLVPALDHVCELLESNAGHTVAGCWGPRSAREVLGVLGRIEPEMWPPLCGCPVHEVGDKSVIDLVGTSHRLFTTLLRPSDGATANVWSKHFEENVRATIDRSDWRPPDPVRSLIGRKITRPDGNRLTDLDAVGHSEGRLLLISCKSIAHTLPAIRGEFAVTRNIMEKIHRAAGEWESVVRTVHDDPSLLGVKLPSGTVVDGLVVFPSVPFYTEAQWRKRVFDAFPYLLSIAELATILGLPRILDAAQPE